MSKHTLWTKLSCDLTPEEIAIYSNELASITSNQSEIEAEKKEVMSDFTAKLNKCIADGRMLARKIITKKEERQVECDLEFDYAKGMVYTVRLDTGVTIGQRKLTDDERQEELDLEGERDRQQEAEEKKEETIASNDETGAPDSETQENIGLIDSDAIHDSEGYQKSIDEDAEVLCGNTNCPSNVALGGHPGNCAVSSGKPVSGCNSYMAAQA